MKRRLSILITAGPTREPIDAVRFISNRSSGKMGLALAAAARAAGCRVTLLAGPGVPVEQAAKPLAGCSILRFNSTADLQQLLDAQFPLHDLLIMAAAVADYRPAAVAAGKLPRDANKPLVLRLEPTPDLVAALAKRKRENQRIIAFALEEPEKLETRAVGKMRRKGVDAIVANSLSTMESESITPLLLWSDGRRLSPGEMSKADFARWLIEVVQGQKTGERRGGDQAIRRKRRAVGWRTLVAITTSPYHQIANRQRPRTHE